MTANSLMVLPELLGAYGGALVLLIVAWALALPVGRRRRKRPGASGHREEQGEAETVRPDGYIDTFAGLVAEGGGSNPTVIVILLVGILAWWAIYLIFNFVTGGQLPLATNPQLGNDARVFFMR
jgi:hypothetical protein